MKKVNRQVVHICKDTFLKCLHIGKTRVQNIAKYFNEHGTPRKKRGGDKKSVVFRDKRNGVKDFLKSLPGRESHYNRNKSRKLYLPSELKNIKNVWKMYAKKHPNLPVAYECFRKIFKFNFNLEFGSPKTDACSFCETVRNQIKAEKNTERKKSLMTDLVIHKKRANSFYDLLKEQREGLKTICFDHQQNKVLPKDPDQQG